MSDRPSGFAMPCGGRGTCGRRPALDRTSCDCEPNRHKDTQFLYRSGVPGLIEDVSNVLALSRG
jgi:hypothetical protein